MSNPQTFYTVGGVDLSNIFQPYTSGTQASATGYKILGGADFNTIFAPYTSGTPASATGYKVGGNDLNSIFAKYNLSTWSALGSGVNNFVSSVAIDSNNNVYAGGNFTNPGNRIAKWNPTDGTNGTWSALGEVYTGICLVGKSVYG